MENPTGAPDVREEETYRIMTINMKCKSLAQYRKGAEDRRREVIISTIKHSSASVIFCQEAPGFFQRKVVEKCGSDDYPYEFIPKDIKSGARQHKVAVMWREPDFESKEITESSITAIEERLKREKSVVDVSTVRTTSAMVKLTSRKTKASFLAVSWDGPKDVDEAKASETLYGLICFVREVCENEKLSWFIIGGDFRFDTSKVDLTEYEGVTISGGPSFFLSNDTAFVFSVPSDKLPMTVNITVSEVEALELENENSENEPLRHVPVVGKLKCTYNEPFIKQDRDTFKEDTSKNPPLVKTPETKSEGKAEVGQGVRKRLFPDASSSRRSQSPSAIPDGYVTREDFEELLSVVKRIEAKIDSLTAEVEKLKLAPPKEQGSDKESTSEKKE